VSMVERCAHGPLCAFTTPFRSRWHGCGYARRPQTRLSSGCAPSARRSAPARCSPLSAACVESFHLGWRMRIETGGTPHFTADRAGAAKTCPGTLQPYFLFCVVITDTTAHFARALTGM